MNLKQSKMIVKNGHWNNENMTQSLEESATIGQPLIVSCIYKSADIYTVRPNLTLTWNSRPWDSISASSRIDSVTRDVPYGMKVIEGRIDQVEDFMFNIDQVIIECKAISHDDIIVKKKHLNLRRKSPPPPPPPYQPSPPQVISSSPADDFVDEANLNSRHSPSSSSLQTDHVYDPEVVTRSVCDNISILCSKIIS